MKKDEMLNISSGLYILSAKQGEEECCCIINSLQLTPSSKRITLCLENNNCVFDKVINTGIFNITTLTIFAPKSLFEYFDYPNGKNSAKLSTNNVVNRSENGLIFHKCKYTNGYLSAKVFKTVDLGTQTMFFADITASETFSNEPSLTYDFFTYMYKVDSAAE